MSHGADVVLRISAGLLILAGVGMLIAGITSTIPFAAIASGLALIVVLEKKGRRDRASHQ